MFTSRIYHSLNLDIVTNTSSNISYILMPENIKEHSVLESIAERNNVNIIVVSGMDWESDMTPWRAPGLKGGEFLGRAEYFMDMLQNDIIFNVENSLGKKIKKRYLIGVSLSGLFAIWSIGKRKIFDGIASISGSFWYDGFTHWLKEILEVNVEKVYISVGGQEKKSRNVRFSSIEDSTLEVVDTLQSKGVEVFFEKTDGGHLAPVLPRIEKAIQSIIQR